MKNLMYLGTRVIGGEQFNIFISLNDYKFTAVKSSYSIADVVEMTEEDLDATSRSYTDWKSYHEMKAEIEGDL